MQDILTPRQIKVIMDAHVNGAVTQGLVNDSDADVLVERELICLKGKLYSNTSKATEMISKFQSLTSIPMFGPYSH